MHDIILGSTAPGSVMSQLPGQDIMRLFSFRNLKPDDRESYQCSLVEPGRHGTSSDFEPLDLGPFPTEIWQLVYSHLHFHDVARLRRVSRGLAEVGAEFLVTRVRFHTSRDSFERVRYLSSHPLLRKNVKTIVYEARLLADVGGLNKYVEHYEMDHHKQDRPQPPADRDASDRAMRLYERNLNKFRHEVQDKFRKYHAKYEDQKELLSAHSAQSLQEALARFTNVQEIHLRTDGRCRHVLSDRFLSEFGRDCAMPTEFDPTDTVWQFQSLVLNERGPRPKLASLEARWMSANFFDGTASQPSLNQAFTFLKSIKLSFRLDRDDIQNGNADDMLNPFQALTKDALHTALAAAKDLEILHVNFDPKGVQGSAIGLKHILGKASWSKLRDFSTDFVWTTEDDLLATLEGQPSLSHLDLGFCALTTGHWANTLRKMRLKLKLRYFWTNGLLEDEQRVWAVDLCDREAWQDGTRYELRKAIDLYVSNVTTGGAATEHNDNMNPLNRVDEEFDDEETLVSEFGTISDDELDPSDGELIDDDPDSIEVDDIDQDLTIQDFMDLD